VTALVDVTANKPRLGGITAAAEKPRDRVGTRPAARTSNRQSAERN
jgi:hypothetical protein